MPDTVTIDQALDAFLRDQRARLSDRTYRNYGDVIRLLRDSVPGRPAGHLSGMKIRPG